MIRPCFKKLSSATADCIRGNGETQSLRSAGGRGDRRVNPDHLTPKIDQRTATVARINCRIGLQQISESIAAIGPPFGTDNPVGYGFFKSKRITNRQNKISGLHHVRIGKLERFDTRLIDFEQGEIHLIISAYQTRLLGSTIAQLHFNLVDGTALSVGHHVIVGDDMALIGHDDARPK